MRDESRIYKFCNELASVWVENAQDWRFGQLTYNVFRQIANEGRDPFFLEEDEMMERIKDYFERN